MANNLSTAAKAAANGNISSLREELDKYFFEGEGQVFAPWSEEKPKKPGKLMKQMLEDAGFDFVSDGVSLQETTYKFTIVTGCCTWTTVSVDYWTWEVEFD